MRVNFGLRKILEEIRKTSIPETTTTMMEEEGEGEGKVCALIEKATNSTAPEVDPRLLKLIKSLARDSESELRLAARTLMSLMKRDHSQVALRFSFDFLQF